MSSEIKNSVYWKSEIDKTQNYLSELIHGELAGVKSTKSSDDTITFQDIDKEIEKCQIYISYCEKQYEKALEEESGQKNEKIKSILYFDREYGY